MGRRGHRRKFTTEPLFFFFWGGRGFWGQGDLACVKRFPPSCEALIARGDDWRPEPSAGVAQAVATKRSASWTWFHLCQSAGVPIRRGTRPLPRLPTPAGSRSSQSGTAQFESEDMHLAAMFRDGGWSTKYESGGGYDGKKASVRRG